MKKLIKSLFTVAMVFGLTVTLAACGGSTDYKGTYKWTFNFPEFEMLSMISDEIGVPGMRLNEDNTVETLTDGEFTEDDEMGTYTYNEETKEIVCTFEEGLFPVEMAGTLDEGVLTLNVMGFDIGTGLEDAFGAISEVEEDEETDTSFSMNFDLLMVFEFDEDEGYYICTSAKILEFEMMTMTLELKKNKKATLTMSMPMFDMDFEVDVTYSVKGKKVTINYPGSDEKQIFTVVDGNLKMNISDEDAAEMTESINAIYEYLGEDFDASVFDFIFVKQAA